ncbi:NAD(P)/FAD-dependent oxidoreductase [Quadrisphaera sp. DSM 44207]|uniref:NAD(P)/FAD-dependent oxidoreductase n=1 Tax=Quadrisphaera sp. DSM 44207 TaxID=1881057 RepID=UPI000890CD2A|nr:NAD(P)/FAD-dependent oxidoreductase [Quadrisphaera sp. DSM 44207]SDQ32612.1 Phytoene dehydrogenase-related protein [Quadrisphaera sp. DSM 44207]
MDSAEVVVVGAGLAGLACAQRLAAAGVPALVLEASDGVGGRVRTDVVDGYRCDRGFQLVNPAYPALPRVVDLARLQLRPFAAGVVVATGAGRHRVADPRRLPSAALESLRAPVGSLPEKAAFARWALGAALADPRRVRDGTDEPLSSALDRAGVHGRLRRSVVTPFLAGVLGEDGGATSAAFTRLVVRSFVRGTPGVPAGGVQALPQQVAASLPAGAVRTAVPVIGVERTGAGVRVGTAAGAVRARAVVVATDAAAAARLLPGLRVPPPRALTTWWHLTDVPPAPARTRRLLHVDGDRRGPLVNSAVLTAVAPGYAPAGADPARHLVASTVLGARADGASERDVRAQLALLYGTATAGWDLLAVHALPHALPAVTAPLQARRPVDLGGGVFVAGDHRDTASQQGALVSGRRAAGAVLAALGAAG